MLSSIVFLLLGGERADLDGLKLGGREFGDTNWMRFDGAPGRTQPARFAISPTTCFSELTPTPRSGFVAVRFYRWGARRFLRAPTAEFAGGIPAEELWGQPFWSWPRESTEPPLGLKRIRTVQAFLSRRFEHRRLDFVDAREEPRGRRQA